MWAALLHGTRGKWSGDRVALNREFKNAFVRQAAEAGVEGDGQALGEIAADYILTRIRGEDS